MQSDIQHVLSAIDYSIMNCHVCGKTSNQVSNKIPDKCSLCGEALHIRLPKSVSRSWGFLITSMIMYIPANVLPIMTFKKLGEGDAHTIVGGILTLIHGGMYPIALVVFIASLLVPLLKMLGIAILLIAVQKQWQANPKQLTSLYRAIECVGRWSMLDIFMISILVAMVDLGGVAKVYAGAGATAFAAVIILTMLSANSFDSRLIWDNMRQKHDEN